ncbi:hypothetical protein C439_08085 [Haloferax mediterranei ATCC 33500]|uniref:Uncharacterized protein n=1 Tax=Haloferax mediterranei (strain ATCC 33500 / DSM 1411 / JCM 8866 / NBRC 14739 / NCIMB 2177 / R-4) TaxID=523841 RepID=M0J0S3_HALMT|nr:hypothetical protein BM92_06925 [Haloferax mediterranei ATCC 33500]EMA02526.1 hypothetical protein C439_08085 [Haloferax mediterranei ATCC 33500]
MLGSQAGATHTKTGTHREYRVKQGDREFEIGLLAGDTPVKELYDLRIPDWYSGDNGATDPGEGPYYESLGLGYLLEEPSTVLFLYDGPDGLSLVALHGGSGDGGSVTWRLTGVPTDADWLVKDDLYTYPDGEPADSNYDRWNVSGSDHVIDWTWRGGRTDGGVLGYLSGEFEITIHPAYNTDATLYGQYYSGEVTTWHVLSGEWDSLTRQSLNLHETVTITCEIVEDLDSPESPESPATPEDPKDGEDGDGSKDSEKRKGERDNDNDDKGKKKEKPEWKKDRDEARKERKEKRDEWQEKRDNGEDDWKEARDEARKEAKEKRDEWQDKRDEWQEKRDEEKGEREEEKDDRDDKDREDDEDNDEDDEDNDDDSQPRRGRGNARGQRRGKGQGKARGRREDDGDESDTDDDDDD